MIYRSKAPLRIGLAGGGTDVSPYCDQFGGAILNASISLYAYATIETTNDAQVVFQSIDMQRQEVFEHEQAIDQQDVTLQLLKGAHQYFYNLLGKLPSGYTLTTFVDAPAGSGLGTSSTLMVAIIGAYAEWLRLPMGEYDVAQLAYQIERKQLGLAGGKQDQYAATFGGVNFMEFYEGEKVIVNPLRIRSEYLHELAHNLLLFYTNTNRESAMIIKNQSANVSDGNKDAIEAMHQLKQQSIMMKEALLKGAVDEIGRILDFGFQQKKKMAPGISNSSLDKLYETALKAGATGGKISGAGGGGFMTFYCPGTTKYAVIKKLASLSGGFRTYQFVKEGLRSWKA